MLGIPKTATQDDIKKAYRELAKTKHPDKGGNNEEFRKIQDAYNTLSNPQKREEYDNPVPQFSHEDISSIFANFFGGGNDTKQSNLDITIQKKISLGDVWKGNKITVEYEKKKVCTDCNNSKRILCKRCNGNGCCQKFVNMPIGRIITVGECDDCKGIGYLYDTTCETCKGQRVRIKKTRLEITLPKCFMVQHMICKEKGHQSPNGSIGSCVIIFEIDTTPFHVDDRSLIYTKEVSLLEALFGHEFMLKLPDDTYIEIKNTSINPDTKNVVNITKGDDIQCNIIVIYKIIFPQVSKDKYEQLKLLLST